MREMIFGGPLAVEHLLGVLGEIQRQVSAV
jgi:hypothetical protein